MALSCLAHYASGFHPEPPFLHSKTENNNSACLQHLKLNCCLMQITNAFWIFPSVCYTGTSCLPCLNLNLPSSFPNLFPRLTAPSKNAREGTALPTIEFRLIKAEGMREAKLTLGKHCSNNCTQEPLIDAD